jgi:hypothetical protein
MDDRHHFTQIPDQGTVPGVSSRETEMTLNPYISLQYDIEEAHKKFIQYAEIIAQGDPLALKVGDLVFYSEVERTAARLFGQRRPRMIECTTDRPIQWTEVFLQPLGPGDFQQQENGTYQCRIRGTLIEVSEANYTQIITGVPGRLLQPSQNLSSEENERRVWLILSSYLQQTRQNLQCKSTPFL